jgi:phospholipase/carboxylesterase
MATAFGVPGLPVRAGFKRFGHYRTHMTEVDLPLVHKIVRPRVDGEGPHPAAFVFHGRGADETDLLPVAQQFPDEVFVVSFRAPDRLQSGYTWYDLDLSAGGIRQSQPDADDFRHSLDLADESIAAAVEAYDLDENRLGLIGFSQGAITAISLLIEHPARFAWVAALHGYLAETHADADPAGIGGTPVFVAAGQADRIIPPGRAEDAAVRLSELGCAVDSNVYDTGHGIGPGELDDLLAWLDERVA